MEKNAVYELKSLNHMIMRNVFEGCEPDKKFVKPTATQMQIMKYIMEHQDKDIYQRDLEEVLKLRRATVSGVLKTMEKNKFITRKVDEYDTRIKKIYLSKESKKIFNNTEEKMNKLKDIIVRDIPQDKMDIFYEVVSKMKENLEKKEL